MKKLLLLSTVLLLVTSCPGPTPEPDPEKTDAREAFVGEYTLTVDARFAASCSMELVDNLLPDTLPMKYDFNMTITKDSIDDTKVNVTGFYNTTGIVANGKLILETSMENQEINIGDISGISQLNGVSLPVNYTIRHSTATRSDDGVIRWHSDAQGSGSVEIPFLNQTVNFQLSGPIENTATPKQ